MISSPRSALPATCSTLTHSLRAGRFVAGRAGRSWSCRRRPRDRRRSRRQGRSEAAGETDCEAASGLPETPGEADCEAGVVPKPQVVPKPPAAPPPKRPTAEPPPATPPHLPREEGMVALPLPPVPNRRSNRSPKWRRLRRLLDDAVVISAEDGLRIPRLAPQALACGPKTSPGRCDDTGQGRAAKCSATGRRAGRRRAAGPAAGGRGLWQSFHGRLPGPWRPCSLAVLQLVYAAWMINVPDWVSARVQMVVCAILTTIYGMLMTLTMITPKNRTLILGLDEVHRAAPAWCGLMFVLMGAATWFCGRASTRWRRSLLPPSEE